MSDIFDYLKWRDDIEFEKINEIDALIFNRISYLPFEKIDYNNKIYSIKELNNLFLSFDDKTFNNYEDKQLINILSKSIRYNTILIKNICYIKDDNNEEQYLSLLLELPNKEAYISFRGTTNYLVDWKEDCNMTYMIVPSQLESVKYVNSIKHYKNIYLGGHSKGGNLAMYSAINCNNSVKKRIKKVFNFDGPGFICLDYKDMKSKIISYIPNTSIVGRLLYQDNKTVVVSSSQHGIKQHNLYSWNIEKDHFIESTLTKESNMIKETVDDWLQQTSIEERKEFIDTLYNIFLSNSSSKISDIDLNNIKEIIKSYIKISKSNKQFLNKVFDYLLSSTKKTIVENIKVKESR